MTEAELKEVLAAQPYERGAERRGYRHDKKLREITTGLGATVIEFPRARLLEDGQQREWQSHLIRRYERRAPSVDSAHLGAYLAGAKVLEGFSSVGALPGRHSAQSQSG